MSTSQNCLHSIGMSVIPMDFVDKKAVKADNLDVMRQYWDNQPNNLRASNFKSDSTLLRLASKSPSHLQNLIDDFLTGSLPRKSMGAQKAVCIKCFREFKNLDHFTEECNLEDYKTRDEIYFNLKSTREAVVINQLKSMKKMTTLQYQRQ
eukprot:NODE_589_length_5652_cov_0.848730.p4 type:complete len:150 gc:universal NODE_589_length_5652_cov_0.848730:1632-1183(-)